MYLVEMNHFLDGNFLLLFLTKIKPQCMIVRIKEDLLEYRINLKYQSINGLKVIES